MDIVRQKPSASVKMFSSLVDGGGPVLGKFPQLTVRNSANTVFAVVSLSEVGAGFYVATYVAPATIDVYAGEITYYDDALHTIPTPGVLRESFCLDIRDHEAEFLDRAACDNVADGSIGQGLFAAAAHAGNNSMVDATVHNSNNNLTASRLRGFPNAAALAAAVAAAPDGADGECYNQKVTETTYNTGAATASAETLQTFKREAS